MRVIGLDIHPDRVSAIEIDTAFGRFEVRDTHELPVLEGSTPESSAERLLASLNQRVDRLVVSAPSEISTFRNLQIASKDKKAVKSALEFELEDDLPFERDNLHYDSVTLSSGQQGSLIHVGATKKESFANFLQNLQNNGLDPEVITTDPWAYRTLLQRIAPETPILLFGLERNKAFFYIHHQNRPILYREIQFGLKKIEQKLEQDFGATQAEIHQWIRDVGVNGIDEKVSNSISDALEALVPEIKQTELAARATLKLPIDQIWITGEGAELPGLMRWLEVACNKSVTLFKPLSLLSGNQLSYSDSSEIHFAKSLALGMATIPLDKLHPINLRKSSFAKINADSISVWELIRKPLPFIAILAVVFFATKSIEYQYYKGRLSDTDDSLKRAVKTYFNVTNGSSLSDNATRNYLADPDKLKKTISTDLAKEREMSKLFAPNNNSPFDFLKSLSQKIGKDIVLDMVQFNAGADFMDSYKENRPFKASLTFLVSNPQMLAKLSDLMERTYKLKKGNSEELTQEGRKVFKIMFSGVVENSK